MIIAKKYKVPDDCPPNCKFIEELKIFDQSSICIRCPIFNCKKRCLPEDKEFCLIRPEDFRVDWAKIWSEWFQGDMQTLPELYL